MDHRAVVDAHVTAFNEGVRTGDFAPMMAGFHHDARLEFRGVAAGPLRRQGFDRRGLPDAAPRRRDRRLRCGRSKRHDGRFVRVAQGGGPARR